MAELAWADAEPTEPTSLEDATADARETASTLPSDSHKHRPHHHTTLQPTTATSEVVEDSATRTGGLASHHSQVTSDMHDDGGNTVATAPSIEPREIDLSVDDEGAVAEQAWVKAETLPEFVAEPALDQQAAAATAELVSASGRHKHLPHQHRPHQHRPHQHSPVSDGVEGEETEAETAWEDVETLNELIEPTSSQKSSVVKHAHLPHHHAPDAHRQRHNRDDASRNETTSEELEMPELEMSQRFHNPVNTTRRNLLHAGCSGGGCTMPGCSCSCSSPSVSCGLQGTSRQLCAPSGEMGFSIKVGVNNGQVSVSVRFYASIGSGASIRILNNDYGGFGAIDVQRDWYTLPSSNKIGICSLLGSTGLGFTGIDFVPSVSSLGGTAKSLSNGLPSCCRCTPGAYGFPQVCYSGSWVNGIARTWNAVASNMPRFQLSAPSGWTISNQFPSVCSSLSF